MIHYRTTKEQYYTACGIPVIDRNSPDIYIAESIHDHRQCTCLKCISKLPMGAQVWHEKNNKAWQNHIARDHRRKKVDERKSVNGY